MIHKVRACKSGSILELFLLLVTRAAYEKRRNVFSIVVGPCTSCVGLRVAIVANASGGATTIWLHLCGEVGLLRHVCLATAVDCDHTMPERG